MTGFRLFGNNLFGYLAAFRSVVWQFSVRLFGDISFGCLAVFCSVKWHFAYR
jgi:hypothetical protein